MKKALFIIAIFSLMFSNQVTAQFNESKLFNAGMAMSLYGRYHHSFESGTMTEEISRPFFLQYETGLGDNIDLEEYGQYITMGLFIGYQKQAYNNIINLPNEVSYEVFRDYQYVWGGVVGSFHGVELANKYFDFTIPPDKWDIYLSLKGGLVMEFYRSNYHTDPKEMEVQLGNIDVKKNNSYIYLAPVIGARYYLIDHLSLFTELGRANLSALSFGISVKI